MQDDPMIRTALLAAAALAALAPILAGDSKPTFLAAKKGQCAKCHNKEAKAWKDSRHARAMDSLKPVTEAEDKARFALLQKAKLDPSKDYSADPKCLRCHATGFGKEGGYPETVTDGNREAAAALGNVTCEACHGAASAYAPFKDAERKKDRERKFTEDELRKLGLEDPTAETCRACHNADVPVEVAAPFDFEKMKGLVHPVRK
jgi:hypothetical protein